MNAKQRRIQRRDAQPTKMQYRELRLAKDSIDAESRTVAASLSSTEAVARPFGTEVLSHKQGAVDMRRAERGLPLLFNHRHDAPIGVVENLTLDGERLRGTLRFSRSQRGEEAWQDVRDGILGNVSIGYQVDEWDDRKAGTRTATRWTIYEASVVTIPADSTVGINRSELQPEAHPMPDVTSGAGAPEATPKDFNVRDFEAARRNALVEGEIQGRAKELDRVADIRSAFARFRTTQAYADLEDACIRAGTSAADAKDALLDLMGRGVTPSGGNVRHDEPNATSGEDAIEKTARGLEEALEVRCNLISDKAEIAERRKGGFVGMSLSEMAREWCRAAGIDHTGDKRAVVGRAFTRAIGHGTVDFTSVLANITTKSLLRGYEEAPETWSAWCRVGSLPDFKQAYRVQMSAFGDLGDLKENGEYTYGTYADHHEPLTLASYGKMFSISRQAIINDDTSAFGTIATGMGRAAARKVGDLAYAVLSTGTSTTLTQDGVALFDASTHGNYVTSGAVPSVATLNSGYTAMATQTDPSGAATLNITPAFIVAPHALRGTIRQLLTSQTDPSKSASGIVNIWQGGLTDVYDARLDAFNAAGWFLMASPSSFDTVEIAFLDGQQAPYLEERDGWSVDGVEFKVRIDAVAKALDFRGAYYNDGA